MRCPESIDFRKRSLPLWICWLFCFHLQFQISSVYIGPFLRCQQTSVKSAGQVRALFSLKRMKEEWQRHNNVLLLSGLFLAEVLNSSLNSMLSLWCHMMDFLGLLFTVCCYEKKKKNNRKCRCQFSGQQATAAIRNMFFFYPSSSCAFWLLKKWISTPARNNFLCCTTLAQFYAGLRCGSGSVCVCAQEESISS